MRIFVSLQRVTLLVVITINTVCCVWEDGDPGVDRPGGDLDNMPILLDPNGSTSQCYSLCKNNTSCLAWSFCPMGTCNSKAPSCYLKGTVSPQSLNVNMVSGVKNHDLQPPKFFRLPLGTITPEGWLKQQLQIQVDGLSGHLQYFWADIQSSSWIGGNADGGLHERFPYWLNGIVPLAYQLNNTVLKTEIDKYISHIVSYQSSDGWLGLDDDKSGNMYWSKYYIMFVMIQYYEATGNETVLAAMFKFLHQAHTRMFSVPLGKEATWAGVRWQDLVLSIHWLLDNRPLGQEQFLWDLAELVYQQGFKWKEYYSGSSFPNVSATVMNLLTHGVNNGMAIKSGGVWFRQSNNKSDIDSCYQRMRVLDNYHGQASGIFSCDEHLAGLMPSRGTELCTVVEAMFSYEVLFGIIGDPLFAERAENITYNALPATMTSDMWAHQYLQQSNEINAAPSDDPVWKSDGPDSTEYGLAPNYGCCTANFNQGWPKMAQSVAMVTPDGNTIAIGIYAPATINYKGALLTITTNYPFDDTVTVSGRCSSPKTVLFRIPSWANGPTLTSNTTVSVTPNTLVPVNCKGAFNVTLKFPMKIRVQRRYNNAASVYRGPLLYALHVKEVFQIVKTYALNQSHDYEVLPASPWDYAIKLTNDASPETDLVFNNRGISTINPPFSVAGSPGNITAKASPIKWIESNNAASAPPTSPVGIPAGVPSVDVTLLPFGATDLRIAEIPTHL